MKGLTSRPWKAQCISQSGRQSYYRLIEINQQLLRSGRLIVIPPKLKRTTFINSKAALTLMEFSVHKLDKIKVTLGVVFMLNYKHTNVVCGYN
jgi:hypothetical protein